jgi:PadR family transcriptional regulator PadR
MDYIQQLMKGVTESVLLYLINEVPMYGYQIIKEMEKRTSGYFKLKSGTIYPALQRLEMNGLIKGKWQQATQRQARKYYQITEKGRQFLADRQADWAGFSTAVSKLMGTGYARKVTSPKVV